MAAPGTGASAGSSSCGTWPFETTWTWPTRAVPAVPRDRARRTRRSDTVVRSVSLDTTRRRRSENVSGPLFVDASCIDCDTCRWMAPEVFDRAGGASRVHRQPTADETRARAHEALLACPTGSIHDEAEGLDLAPAMARFPLPITEGVDHLGYHAEDSFGATSYLIRRPAGNVMVDCPRFARPLVERLEQLGGLHTIVLTHSDDVADHARYAEHFGARRVLHRGDLGPGLESVEVLLEDDEPVELAPDLLLIPTPGHTDGSVCLLFENRVLFSGDHLAWSEARLGLTAFPRYCRGGWDVQRRSVERLLDHRFTWLLPGHGRRCQAELPRMRELLRECLTWMDALAEPSR